MPLTKGNFKVRIRSSGIIKSVISTGRISLSTPMLTVPQGGRKTDN